MGISLNRNSKFFKMGTLFIGNIISLFIGLITAPIITRIVDPNEYGQVSFFTMYTNIYLLFSSLGLERAYIRYYYETKEQDRRILLFQCVKTSLTFFAFSIPIVVFLFTFTDFEVSASKYIIVAIFVINGFSLTMERFAGANLRIQQKSLPYAVAAILNKAIYGLLAVILVLTIRRSEFLLVIISTTVASTIHVIISILSDKKNWSFKDARMAKSPWQLRELLKYCLPLMVHGMVAIVFQSADKLMIKFYGDYSQVGVYASAGYYLTICNVFVTAITTITGPEMFEYHAKNPTKTKFFADVNKMMSFIMFALVFTIIFCKDILVLLLGEKYREAGTVMPFLMIGIVMTAVAGVNSISIEIRKKTGYNVLITVVSAVVNIVGNYFLIPILGIKGAAISTGCSYCVFFLLTTIISKKLLDFDMSLIKYGCISALLLLFAVYNTFFAFNWITVTLYVASMVTVIIFYWGSIRFLLEKMKEIITKKGKKIDEGKSNENNE